MKAPIGILLNYVKKRYYVTPESGDLGVSAPENKFIMNSETPAQPSDQPLKGLKNKPVTVQLLHRAT